MSTGGFRDISTLSTGRRPRSMTMSDHGEEDMRDVEMNSATALLEEDDHYFEDEKSEHEEHLSPSPQAAGMPRSVVGSMTGVRPLIITPANTKPPRKLKSILKNLKADQTIILSRPRVVFRTVSLITSGAVLGASGHILFHYMDTRYMKKKNSQDQFIWGEGLRLAPTNILLAVSTYVFVLDTVFSVASFWPRGRYLKNPIVAGLALLHSIISLIAGIIALVYSDESRNSDTTLFWVCTVKEQSAADLAAMDFSTHCTELRATWAAACMYTVAHGLIIPTILLGFISCGSRRRPTFQDAVIIGDTEKTGFSGWLRGLKGRLTGGR